MSAEHLAAIRELVGLAAELPATHPGLPHPSPELGPGVWLRGGWAVDFTVGHLTRPHADIDWFADVRLREALTDALLARGFQRTGDAPAEQQTDLVLGEVEHGIAWIIIEDGAAVVAGGPWAGAPWPPGMLPGTLLQLHGVSAPVISTAAQIEIKELTPLWQPHLPRREKDLVDIELLRSTLG